MLDLAHATVKGLPNATVRVVGRHAAHVELLLRELGVVVQHLAELLVVGLGLLQEVVLGLLVVEDALEMGYLT